MVEATKRSQYDAKSSSPRRGIEMWELSEPKQFFRNKTNVAIWQNKNKSKNRLNN